MNKEQVVNVMIAGLSYQDTSSIVQAIAQAATQQGIPHSGMDLSTGTSGLRFGRHYVRLGEKARGSYIPLGEGDILLGLEAGCAARCAAEIMSSHGTALINTWQYHPPYVAPPLTEYPTIEKLLTLLNGLLDRVIPIDAVGIAKEAGDNRQGRGVLEYVMLGALIGTKLLPFSAGDMEGVLAWLCIPQKKESVLRAFYLGVRATAV